MRCCFPELCNTVRRGTDTRSPAAGCGSDLFSHVATVPDWHKLLLQSELRGKTIFIRGIGHKTERQGRWRKRKGVATVRLRSGRVRRAELHWYEAHGIGKRGLKIKRFLDEGL